MQKIYFFLITIILCATLQNVTVAQSVLNPNDTVVTYNSSKPPTQPSYGQIGKWVRTKRLSWNTDSYKAYIYKGCAFRLKFPKTYNPTANDGKKYPMLIFFHGLGETGNIYDNEYQLYHGGQQFSDNVDNGNFDGYIFCMQSQGFWGAGQYQFVSEIIDYMVANNKLDLFRVSDNGLSAGGQGTWEMLMNYPTYISAALPMSNVSIGYTDTSVVNKVKYTAMWNFQGGLDGSPAPSTGQQVRDAILGAGGNYKYTEYSDLGHGTWDRAWSEPDFYPFILRSYSSNPWALYGRTEFCSLDSINVTLGLTNGFDAYEWRKDGTFITGASLNTLQVTQPGTYDARVRKGSIWSDWSRTPVQVKIKTATVTPSIQVSGLASKVLPSLDGNTNVKLEVPDGYAGYIWQKVGGNDTISTTRFANVIPGDYKVKVTELYGCSSSFSNAFTVVNANGQNKPDAAINLKAATVSKTSIKLNWSDNPSPAYNETNFEVYQSIQSGSAYKLIGTTATDILTFNVDGLNSNTRYYYKVRAVNTNAAAVASNEANAKTLADTLAPTAPSNLSITGSTTTSVSLSWTASSDDVGVSKYEVYVNGVKSYVTSATQFTVNNLVYGQYYNFTVKARDLSNNLSPASNQVTGQPLLTGLNYKYYTFTGTWSALPDFNTLTPKATGVVPNVALDNKTQNDNFAFLWEGFINIPVTGSYTFRTNSDDGSKLYLGALNQTTSAYSYSGTALVNNDGLHAPQDKTSSTITLTAGVYPIAISFYEQTGGETMTMLWNTPQTGGAYVTIPNSAFVNAPVVNGQVAGLNYKYYTYTGSWSAMPDFNTLTPKSTGNVPNVTIANATQTDYFSYLWEGYINIPVTGTYYFKTNSDDGSKLYLGSLNQLGSAYSYSGTAIVNNDGLHAAQDKTSSAVTLTAGIYPIAITFYEQTGSQSIAVSWNTPQTNGSYIAIPNTAFVNAPPVTASGGLKYKYYTFTGTWNSLPDFKTLTPASSGSVSNVTIANAAQADNFAYLWEGFINIPVTGSYTFKTNSDDGSKLYLGGLNQTSSAYNYSATATVNNDGLHSAQDKFSSTLTLAAGVYAVAITFYEQTGSQTMSVAWKTPQSGTNYVAIPNSAFVDAPKGNIKYKHYTYTTTYSKLPDYNTLTPVLTGVSSTIGYDNRTQTDKFGYLWEGYISVPVSGSYTFKTNSDEGSKFYLGALNQITSPYNYNATATVDNDGIHTAQDKFSSTLTLTAGVYPFALSYFDATGSETVTLSWKTPQTNGSYVTIPSTSFVDSSAIKIIPAKPTNLTATAISAKRINLSWTDNSSNETVFEIWRSTDALTGFASIGTVTANTTTYADSSLSANTTYYYRVRAIGQNGESDFDKEGSGVAYSYYEQTALTTLPDFNSLTPKKTGRVSTFALGGQDVNDNFQFKYSGVINIATAGTYTFYTSSDDGSKLYLDGFDETFKVVDNNGAHATQEKSGTKYLTAGLHNIYVTYMEITGSEVLAVSYSGTNVSKQIIPTSVLGQAYTSATTQGLPIAPIAPSNLDASGVSTTAIKINWLDKSSTENKFELYRSDNTNTNYILLATLPANATSYNDSALFSNAVYYYKVRALNDGGASAYSNEDSGKTKNIPPVIVDLSNQYVRYDGQLQLNVQATDADGYQLTYAVQNQPSFVTLVNNGNATATLMFNPAGANLGTYNNISVIVSDANGGSDTTKFNLTVGSNYNPVITGVPDYTLSEGDTLSIPLIAQDQDNADVLTWSITSLSGVGTVTNVSNGISSLFIKPNYSSAGVYNVQATISDGNGGIATAQFKITVVEKDPNTRIFVRFMDQDPASDPWNSITGVSTYNLKDATGNNSHVNLEMQTSWWAAFHEGPQTGNNSGVYPDAILRDYYYFGIFGGPETVDSKLTGLDTSSKFNLTFYAGSIYSGTADNGITTYTAGGQTVSLAVQNNTQNTVSINGLKPDANGSITFTMTKGANTPVGYINALVISSLYDDKTAPAKPLSLYAQNAAGGVQLSWKDVAYNETGYEVYRSLNAAGAYAKISQISPDATAYLDTAVNGTTQYYYKVRAINSYGASAYSDSVNIITADKVPQIAAIGNVILKNNQQINVSVIAKDDSTDHLRLTALNLPSFATFVDNGNGTGSISITPSLGSTGIYQGVVITAADNSDSSRSTSFDISIVDKDVSSVYLNFSDGSLASKPWNNLTGWPFAGTTFSNLVDDSNLPTTLNVTLVDGFQGVVASGMRPGNGKGVYPEVVMRTAEFEASTSARTIKIAGLSSSKKYNFVFFNSHDDGLNGLTNFTINGQTVSLNASYNLNKTVQINGISPDANGNVTISVAKGTGADYAYISSLIIQSFDAALSTLSPVDLRVIDTKRTSVTLQWADRSYNETGFEVWRATQSNGQYSLLKALAANTTSYTDAGLSQNTTYYYTVRAVNNSAYTNYSNTVSVTTYGYSVQLNFTEVNMAPAPWNNLNAIPQLGYTWNNFIDETSLPTSIGMQVTNTWAGLYSAGVNPLNNSGVYPDSVMIDSYGLFPGQTGTLKITGLNLSMKYDFTFFASSQAYGDVNVAYTVNGKTVLLNTSLNTKGTVTLYGITPDENGEVNISVAPGTSTSQFGLIGAMIIQGFNAPASSAMPNVSGGVSSQSVASARTAKKAKPVAQKTNIIELSAYPNPFTSYFNLSVSISQKENIQVEIYNIGGKVVYQNRFMNLNAGLNTLKIQPNGSMLSAGIYIVKISFQNQNTSEVLKLIKE